jgi:hypothetical protein
MLLFGVAAVILAAAALLVVWQRSRARDGEGGGSTTVSPTVAMAAGAAALLTSPPVSGSTPLPAPTVAALPTPGPSAAADAVVGAPRYVTPPPTRVPRPTATQPPRVAVVAPPPPPPAEPPADTRPAPHESRESSGPIPDASYRTRKYAKFGVSPDQARMYVDGHYVGIADDWDDRGGGRKFEFTKEGTHRVRFELPGYRDLNVEILVTSGANDDTADVGDELKRESRQPYTKLPGPVGQTVGPVVFQVDPPDAIVSEGGKTLGPASSFTDANPLRLPGPTVHDLVISAPGYQPRSVRVLVGPSADKDKATVKVELKKG